MGKGSFKDSPKVLRWHVCMLSEVKTSIWIRSSQKIAHCLDFLRQRLMCTVDISVLGVVWVNKSNPVSFTDFNTKHVCRNFEQIRAWAEEHQLPLLPRDYLVPPGPDTFIWDQAP